MLNDAKLLANTQKNVNLQFADWNMLSLISLIHFLINKVFLIVAQAPTLLELPIHLRRY